MSKLTNFLLENSVENITEEVVISDRLKDENGEFLKFKIKALTPDEFSDLQKECTVVGKKGKVSFNSKAFNERLIVNNTLEPDFKDANFIKQANCISPEQVLNKVLLAGEVSALVEAITKLSGFDSDLDSLRAEAKN